jgi:dihydrofolate reductase
MDASRARTGRSIASLLQAITFRPIGGADLASTLLAANLIDELVLKLNPLLLGEGIPLFSRIEKPVTLE